MLIELSNQRYLTKIKIAQTNHVNRAVKPEIPIEVLTIEFAATAPATPSSIMTRPAK